MSERSPGLLGGNAFKLGLFGSNCSGGLAFTRLPERWQASWDNNLRLAELAEASGLECLVPVARWKGFGGATNVNATSLETITWACGLLAHTQRMTVFEQPMSLVYGPIAVGCFLMLVRALQRLWRNARDGWRAAHAALGSSTIE